MSSVDFWKQVGSDGAAPSIARARPWRDDRRVVRLFSPHQNIPLALIRPLFNAFDQLRAHGILQNILPLLGIVFRAAQLGVPKISLPERGIPRARPVTCCIRFPESHPLFDWPWREFRRRTKEMHMIRHQNIPSNLPRFRRSPRIAQNRVRQGIRKHWLPADRTDGQKHDGWRIEPLVQRRMRRMMPSGFVHDKGLRQPGILRNENSRR